MGFVTCTFSQLFSFMDDDIPITSNVFSEDDNEFQKYLADPNFIKNDDALRFWRNNHTSYPVVSQIAQKCFAVPATSAPIERVFSHAGIFYILTDHVSHQKTLNNWFF